MSKRLKQGTRTSSQDLSFMIRARPVTGQAAIRSAAREIRRRFETAGKAYADHAIGTPGGGWHQTLYWIPTLGLWGGVQINKERWHDLIFGLTDPVHPKQIVPDAKSSLSVVGNRALGGLIVRDDAGSLLLAHSGRIGGGKVGVSTAAFRKAYDGPKCLVQFKDTDEWYAIVGRIEEARFLEQVSEFVNWVYLFKHGDLKKFRWRFNDEFFESFRPEVGTKSERRGAEVNRTHQDVVNALHAELLKLSLGKVKVTNDELRDLIQISTDGQPHTLFEVKTSADRQSIYMAIGQLLFNQPHDDTKLVIVAPKVVTTEKRVVARLKELNISLIGYTKPKDAVLFHGLRHIVAK